MTGRGGLPVADLTRTAVDVARWLAGMGAVPGVRRAARVPAFAHGPSGSVGESRSRVVGKR